MIDPSKETLLTLAEAARTLPRRRRGRPVHVSCLYRWTVSGCRGIFLESIQIGGTRCTSHEAMRRFFANLSSRNTLQTPLPKGSSSRASQRAERELRRLGI
jgi:hypothetical protein